MHEELGFNFRMSNLQAAVGLAQLERLDEFILRKQAMGRRYTELLGDLDGIELPQARTDYAANHYWVFGIVLADDLPIDSETLALRLGRRGIGTRPFFWPMHEQPVLKRMGLAGRGAYPVAERLARRGLYLPSGLALTPQQIDEVAQAVREEIS